MYTDKIAGLESRQFVRDENRFGLRVPPPKDVILPRQPRIGTNTRNTSHQVFAFGNTMDYKAKEERYICNAAGAFEKAKTQQKADKLQERMQFKRYFCI
jgi:hypothetical protein